MPDSAPDFIPNFIPNYGARLRRARMSLAVAHDAHTHAVYFFLGGLLDKARVRE